MFSLGVNDWNWNWNWEMEWGFDRGRHSSLLFLLFFSLSLLNFSLLHGRPWLNFINVLRSAFTRADPECAKKTVKSAVLFGAFGTYGRKSCA